MVMQVSVQTELNVDHKVLLQGIGISQLQVKPNFPPLDDQESGKPVILQRTDPDFINGILTELAGDRGIHGLSGRIKAAPDEELTLFQPVHRTFYIVLLEVVCDPFGNSHLQSRLDSQKIESAGLVVRRIIDQAAPSIRAGWRQQRCWDIKQQQWTRSQSWVEFKPPTSKDENLKDESLDPDPSRRPRQTILHPEIDHFDPELSESVSPLFVAPPDICAKTGRTILYGLVPVTSFEVSEAPPSMPDLDQDDREHLDRLIKRLYLPYYLRQEKPRSEINAGKLIDTTAIDIDLRNHTTLANRRLAKFITSLQYLKLQFNTFEQINFLSLLNQLSIETQSGQLKPLGNFLQQAARILVDREPGTVEMPLMWPKVTADQRQEIVEMMRSQWMNRLAKITAGKGRYDDLTARYQVRAFIRVKSPDGCPPKITWSYYSNPFTIAPWYANNPDLPPIKITLPDVLDAKEIAAIKPSVAFAVPPKLFNFLRDNDDLKKLLDGDGSNSDDSGFDWICSFNIPIITLCAYIVLNIFLKLFNFVFWWLFSIKICIPVPKGIFPKKTT